jgi:uncharacterized protein (TIGR03790 family)
MNSIRASWPLLWGMLLVLVLPGSVMGLESAETLIVANRQSSEGVELARYYARMRDIPEANLLWLNLSTAETCSRDVYEQRIAAPVREFLAAIQPSWRIRCLVLIYGLPLKVRPAVTVDEKDGGEFKARQEMLQHMIEYKGTTESPSAPAEELETVRSQLNQLKITRDQVASVDSELTVVKAPEAPIGGWIENPFYIGFRDRDEAIPRENVLMVSRLDGPTADSVKRIIDDTLSAEKNGLRGTAYFDARWPISPSPEPSGYQRYDNSIHRAAQQVEKSGKLPVRIDETPTLFQPGQCPDAALYCGWYSLANYVDAFQWHQGAIGYHIASSECTTLKKKNSQVWCKRMIEDGICATIGPVAEPYVQAFPMPEVFFGFLTEGILSLAECYMVSLPYLSWKMVLIGDPLYHPFLVHSSK